jgi:subtilisin family serine protease
MKLLVRYSLPFVFLALVACQSKKENPPAPPAPPASQSETLAAPKPKIEKLDDLPRHTYPITGSAVDLVNSDAAFADLATKVRADVEKDLATYDIEDKTTLKRLKGTLLTLDLIEGKNDDARTLIAELRGLEDKPAAKLMAGFITEVRLDTMKKTGLSDISAPAFQTAFQKDLADRAGALPWNVVQDELKQAKGSFEIRSRNLLLGVIQSEIDPAVKQTGNLSSDLADTLISIRASFQFSLPLKAPVVAALTTVIDAHNVVKPDIWNARAVTLSPDEKLTPVVIGIWDSGVDTALYPHQLFTNPNQKLDGKDDDNNGFVDDVHGIAFDLHSNRVTGTLYPLGDNAGRGAELREQIKGLLDIDASVESPESTALRKQLGALSSDKVKPFLEDLDLFGNYIHGTHVAGIAVAGNPFARILVARITFDYHLIPEKPTVEQAQKDVLADQAAVDYFKAHGVRVVNMSWGGSLKDVEDALEKNGVGNADERKKEARQIFDIGKDGLYNALKGAPDILFIASAGNSDNDVNFDEMVPSSFVLPNFVTVGAVDQAGDETSFTSFGKNVLAYADGFEVSSYIPGGTQLKLSGTSMSSPEVTNLAAKLFALDPKLTPTDVIDLIRQGLDTSPSDPRIHLLDPKKSVELLKSRKTAGN